MKTILTVTLTLMGLLAFQKWNSEKTYKNVGGNIDIQYHLEVTEDSVWIESVETKQVVGGKIENLNNLLKNKNL